MTLLQPLRQSVWIPSLAGSKTLTLTGAALLLISCLTLVLMVLDPRLFQGVSVWSKPWKFQLSTGVFLLNLAYFMSFLPAIKRHGAAAKFIVWGCMIATVYEIGYITLQGALGQASHFNLSSPMSGTLYTLMGIGAMMLTTAALVLGVLVLRHSKGSLTQAMRHAIGWGLVLSFFLGSAFGGYLGGKSATGHWVGGAATDAGGWLFFNWSRTGGDLRVAHFFGLHAMQVIPLIALLLASPSLMKLSPTAQIRGVWLTCALYTAWCVWTFVQAVRGQPFM